MSKGQYQEKMEIDMPFRRRLCSQWKQRKEMCIHYEAHKAVEKSKTDFSYYEITCVKAY